MKKIIIPIAIILILAIIGGLLYFFVFNKDANNENEKEKIKDPIYVEENGFKVSEIQETYSNPIYCYTMDEDKNIIDIGFKFEDSNTTQKFYDYSVSEPDEDGNIGITFKYNIVSPLKYTKTDYSYTGKNYYTFHYSGAILFDYYTGEIYNKNNYDISSKDKKEFGYTDIKWSGNTTKVGVYTVTDEKWDGKQTVSENVYSDTCRKTVTYYISVPKDYDGLMLAIQKSGIDQAKFDKYKKYQALSKEAEKSGTKSEELIKMDERANSIRDLRNYSKYDDTEYAADDFYVFRVSDITPAVTTEQVLY